MNDTYDVDPAGSDIQNPQEPAIEGWEFVDIFKSKNELEAFLGSYTHKMTASHGGNPGICSAPFSVHPSKIQTSHKHTYGYYRCSSTKCVQQPEERCSFSFKVACHTSLIR